MLAASRTYVRMDNTRPKESPELEMSRASSDRDVDCERKEST